MKKNNSYEIDLWEESEARFGIALNRLLETYWSTDKIRDTVSNWKIAKNIKGVTALHIVKRLDGSFFLNQISGYTDSTGMYCYMVGQDGKLVREI